ncbi:putative phosphate permease [Alteripontixanthobacter maritimus]|uniref:Putative phosphate permease n=1 Tax=Alteripontixanthobacter maritimus TaxID=2161824 RepID=A0A369Q3N6_9SPHN|nr:inorganic phosphate transporter [Alteripontixanthobacter maritimus]RDC59503.1 putative phosphate permease [Alteripontixanthobacter maritimus]
MTIALLAFAALFLAFSNGANDNFKGFATVWGSATLPYRRALIMATGATVLGGLASVFIADGLVAQFSGKGLVGDDLANTPGFALAVAAGAAGTVILATRLGFPVSTTHALVGGLVGAGLALSDTGVALGNLGTGFVLPLLTSPFLSAGLAFAVFVLLRLIKVRRARSAVGYGGMPGLSAATTSPRPRFAKMIEPLHLLSAASICFARGVNDTPKIAALLIGTRMVTPQYSALAVALAMAVGGWLLSRRVAETMSLKLNRLDAVQGVSANLITAGLVLGASRFGLPVSTTHVSVGSIIGTGAAAGTLDLSVVRSVLLSWVATLPVAAGLAYAIGTMLGV